MDKVHVELAGRLEGLLDHVLGDGVEGHAVVSLELQRLFEMPRDRFALAVGVGGQVDLIRARRARLEAVHNALAALSVLIL